MEPAKLAAFQWHYCFYLATQHSKYIKIFWALILLLSLSNSVSESSKAPVKTLPGFPGVLPFSLETGYISVNDSELFYYFLESQGNPQEDPLFLWLTGGPGCSSFSGIVYEIGPIEFDVDSYDGGLPKFSYYPHTWTKSASFIFLDSPVGTGFSYSKTEQGWLTSDTASSNQAYHFLRKWLEENPQYLTNRLFIGGDSYSGIIVPLVTKLIVQDNEAGLQPLLNLKGYLLGSPRTDSFITSNSKIPFAHRMALISDNLYEKLKSRCNGNYVAVDPSNGGCLTAIAEYDTCIGDIWTDHILEPNCQFASPKKVVRQRSLQAHRRDFVLSPPRLPEKELGCPRVLGYALSYTWANDGRVQDALNVRRGKVKEWDRCNKSLAYTQDVQSVIDIHQWLSKTNLTLLINVGDHDMVVNFVGTEMWIKTLNFTVVHEWHPWFVDKQVEGYTRKYSESSGFDFTFLTVKGAGHTAPEYSRRGCYQMFERWIHGNPV